MRRIFQYVPDELLAKHAQVFAEGTWTHIVDLFTPFRLWLYRYDRAYLRNDIIAGLTVSTVLVPQAMAYAFLVGLPPQMGLYAIIPSVALGALFGSSRHVITAPVGIVSLLTITALLPFAHAGTETYIFLATILAITVGFVQILLGVFQFGFLARLIPHSVLIGFSTAAALIIASTQVPSLLGFSIVQQEHVWETLRELALHVGELHLPTVALGVVALLAVLGIKRFRPQLPAGLIVILAGLCASYVFALESVGIKVVGVVPSVLPIPDVARLSLNEITSLLGSGFIIGFIGFVETFAIGKAVATTTKQQLSANQELVGQGVANIGAGLFGGLPVSGSFSSTGVNVAAGAKTGLSGIVVSLVAVCAVLFFTPILYFLPRAVLAAIVIAGALQLVHAEKFWDAFRVSHTDGVVAFVVFALSFLFKPDDAVVFGVVFALAIFMQRIMWARVVELGFDEQWNILRRVGTKDCITTIPEVLIARIDMSIFYANTEHVVSQMRDLFSAREARGETPSLFVMDFSGVNYIDLTASELLGEFLHELRAKDICIAVIYAHTRERTAMRTAHKELGDIHFLHNIAELKDYVQECPLHKKNHISESA
jgi:SulP family sulfate permease